MNQRIFVLAVPALMVACAVETTSLGGPRGSQSSASSTDERDAAPPTGWSPPAYDGMDAGRSGAFPCAYSWLPVPAAEACQYLLPVGRQNESPDLDPATWDPRNVGIELFEEPFVIGGYKETPNACGSDHGWYYVPAVDGGPPTTFALCPSSCAALESDDNLRLSAFGWCGP